MDEEFYPEEQARARPPIEWDAYEYVHTEKAPEWYWALGLVAVSGCVAALLFNNVLFAILILIAAFVLAIYAAREPNIVHFAITQRGIRIDNKLHPYSMLESFSIDERHPHEIPNLIVNPKHFFSPLIIIPLDGVDADDIHDRLSILLDEDEHVEPFSHRIMHWLGF